MRKFLLFGTIVLLLAIVGNVFADISFHGDARVRPRLDQKFSNGDKTYQDLYYLYWIRFWARADLTDGWYAVGKLATDGPGDFIGVFGKENPGSANPTGNYTVQDNWDRNSANGVVRFGQAYFGKDGKKAGFSMGLLPFDPLAHPELDFHFFPGSSSDIPFNILAQTSATGFRGYYKTANGQLNTTVTVDDNNGYWDGDPTTDDPKDQYSVLMDFDANAGDFKIQPTLLKTFGSDMMPSPLTFGVNGALPKIGNANFTGGAYFTTQKADSTSKYDGFFIHAKTVFPAGPGTVVAWADYSSLKYDMLSDRLNSLYVWLMYKIVVYKSELGNFSINPTYRIISQKQGDLYDYSRNKIEVTLHLTFK